MAEKDCGSKSKAMLHPEMYECKNGRSVLKKEFRKPRGKSTACVEKSKFAQDKRYECNEKTNFRWKLKKGFKLAPVEGAPKKPLTPFFRYIPVVRQEKNLKGMDLVSTASKMWKVLSSQEKAPFDEAYRVEKERYDALLATFKTQHGETKQIVAKPKRPLSKYSKFMSEQYKLTAAEIAPTIENWETLPQKEKLKIVAKEVAKKWHASKA